jgi:DNA-binding CsgD family transcriptional regulator
VEYQYKYIAGGIGIIDVDAEWVEILDAFEYEEVPRNRCETRHHVYLSTLPQGGEELLGKEPTPEQAVCHLDSQIEIMQLLDTLTPRQLEVLRKRLDGLSGREIAREDGIHKSSVEETIAQIQKKFRNTPAKSQFPRL